MNKGGIIIVCLLIWRIGQHAWRAESSGDDVEFVDSGAAGVGGSSVLLSADTKLELPSGSTEGDLKPINDQIKTFDLGLKPEDIVIVKARKMFR